MHAILAKNVGIQSVDWFLGLVWSWALRGRQGVSPPMYPDDLTFFVPAGVAAFGQNSVEIVRQLGEDCLGLLAVLPSAVPEVYLGFPVV